MDYLFGNITFKTHNNKFISDITGLSEKSIEMLKIIRHESKDDLPHGFYTLGSNKPDPKIVGTGKTLRVINELLENEYRRFVVEKEADIMDNLFSTIDEYMHPKDFIYGTMNWSTGKFKISSNEIPSIMDQVTNTITSFSKNEISRSILLNRITGMLNHLSYDMDYLNKKR